MELNPERAARVNKTEATLGRFRRVALLLVLAGIAGFWLLMHYRGIPTKPQDIASSFAGVAGSFWALAGLVLVYVAFLGQQIELQYNAQAIADQQEEIRLNRGELAGQREQLEQQAAVMREQVDAVRRQTYESTFFELARVYRVTAAQSVVAVTNESGPQNDRQRIEHRGAHAHRQMVSLLATRLHGGEKNAFRSTPDGPRVSGAEDRGHLDAGGIKAAYDVMFEGHQDYLELIFDALEAALVFVDLSPESEMYAKMLDSQVSVMVRELLFYHVWTGTASKRLTALVLKYGILDRVGPDHIVEPYHAQVMGATGPLFVTDDGPAEWTGAAGIGDSQPVTQ